MLACLFGKVRISKMICNALCRLATIGNNDLQRFMLYMRLMSHYLDRCFSMSVCSSQPSQKFMILCVTDPSQKFMILCVTDPGPLLVFKTCV